MSSPIRKLFTEHPQEVGETYIQHMAASSRFGFKLLGLAACAFIHALIPALHRTTVSSTICRMAKDMDCRAAEARQSRMNKAGAWDVGL